MSTTVPSPTASIGLIEGWGIAVYFCVYLAYLFVRYESKLLHWLSLVALPLVVVFPLRRGEAPRRSEALTRSRVAAVVLASRRNVLACAVLHSLINALPAMTMIKMGGSP